MKTFKKNPKKQLEKFSTIFTQLGLVLVLFVVLISLEHKTEIHKNEIAELGTGVLEIPYEFNEPIIIVKNIEKVKQTKREVEIISCFKNISKVDDKVVETVIDLPKKYDDVKVTDVNSFKEAYEDDTNDKDDPAPISIKNVQNIPVFKGCEGLTEEETRVCFEKKIQRHVQRYFNSEIAQDAGLRSGMYKIYTQFVIDTNGDVSEINIRAPHKRLEKEANKVITKIPQFIPGKQNNKPVNVRYTLPITFKVD